MCLSWPCSGVGEYNPFYIKLVLHDPLNLMGNQYKVLIWLPEDLLYFRAHEHVCALVSAMAVLWFYVEAVCLNRGVSKFCMSFQQWLLPSPLIWWGIWRAPLQFISIPNNSFDHAGLTLPLWFAFLDHPVLILEAFMLSLVVCSVECTDCTSAEGYPPNEATCWLWVATRNA